MANTGASREFYIAAVLVSANAIFGFWRYSPRSPIFFVIAVFAGVVVVLSFWRKQRWARNGAMLIAVLGIAADLMDFGEQAVRSSALAARIALAATVLYWLGRAGVRAHFGDSRTGACLK